MNVNCRGLAAFLMLGFVTVPAAWAYPPLQEAAASGNVNEVRRLIASDSNALLARDEDGCVALHHAAWNGQSGALQVLLEAGTPPDYPKRAPKQGMDGGTALEHAAVRGYEDIAQMLLKAGAKVDAKDNEQATALHYAAWNNQLGVAKILLAAGADPNARRTPNETPLAQAAYFGHIDMVRLLISRGANVNARIFSGNTALHQAARKGQWQMCRILAQNKADLEATDDSGRTALHIAAENGQAQVALMLIAMGADLNAKDSEGHIPIALAQGEAATVLKAEMKLRSDAEANDLARAALNAKLMRGQSSRETTVYQSRFTSGHPGPEWSTSPLGPYVGALEVKAFSNGSRHYLGDFGTQAVRLSLSKLPPHSQMTVIVNVLALSTWDGNGIQPGSGPDFWEAAVAGGPTLFRTTFCNMNSAENAGVPIQAFPGEWPRSFNAGGAGAMAKNLLKRNATREDPAGQPDGVYRVAFTFAHDAPYVVLSFSGRNLEDLSNESWGLGNVEVRVGQVVGKPGKLRKH